MWLDDTCELGGWHSSLAIALAIVLRLVHVKQYFLILCQFFVGRIIYGFKYLNYLDSHGQIIKREEERT